MRHARIGIGRIVLIRCDVVVVGAGPAGSMTAAALARRGYTVRAFDRALFPRDKACAEYCPPGVADVLERAGVWASVAPYAVSTPGMNVCVGGLTILPVRYGAGGVVRTGFSVPRIRLDSMLLEHARRCGADVREGERLTGITNIDRGFSVTIVNRAGESTTMETRAVVAADGLYSPAARLLGVRSTGRWPQRLGLVSHFATARDLECGEMHVGSGLYCGLATVEPGVMTVGLVVDLAEARARGVHGQALPEWALERLPAVRARLEGATMLKPARGIGPMSRRVDRVAGAGFLLVGDAAGFLDPFTGEGLYRALRGSELAIETIDVGLRRTSTATVPDLTGYAQSRRRVFAGKERVTWIIQVAMTQPRVFTRLARSLAGSSAARTQFGNILGDIARPTPASASVVLGGMAAGGVRSIFRTGHTAS
jgi:flavin-dependent dehydrogenase